MNYSGLLQRFLLIFFIIAIILPISSTLLFLFGMILKSMNLLGMATVLENLTLISVIAWFVSLIGLLLLLTVDRLIKQ